MAISDTYLGLQNRIADELGARLDLLTPLAGSNLTLSPIQNAIQSAIAKWEREPFYFNELFDQTWFTTVPGQTYYTSTDEISIKTLAKITKVAALVNANRYTLIPRTWQYLQDISVNEVEQASWPADYAYFAQTILLYPTPAEANMMQVSGIERFVPLVADTDANVWTQDAFDLIRCEAKLILSMETLYDDDLAGKMKIAIYGDGQMRGYLPALKGESARRGGGGSIRPTYF
jgi:hypothetical protein